MKNMPNVTLTCQSCGCSYSSTIRRDGEICGDLSNAFHISCPGTVTFLDPKHAKALRVASNTRDHVANALAQVSKAPPDAIEKLTRETFAAMNKMDR